jgi:hypothetical protein
MSIPPADYQILVKQSFRCKGVADYACPMFMRTFDRSGYHIFKDTALCPACHAVAKQTPPAKDVLRDQARHRIGHFIHSKGWIVGSGEYTLPFRDFWEEFYRWSEAERMYTKKTLVRSVLAELCGVTHDATHHPISPQ